MHTWTGCPMGPQLLQQLKLQGLCNWSILQPVGLAGSSVSAFRGKKHVGAGWGWKWGRCQVRQQPAPVPQHPAVAALLQLSWPAPPQLGQPVPSSSGLWLLAPFMPIG